VYLSRQEVVERGGKSDSSIRRADGDGALPGRRIRQGDGAVVNRRPSSWRPDCSIRCGPMSEGRIWSFIEIESDGGLVRTEHAPGQGVEDPAVIHSSRPGAQGRVRDGPTQRRSASTQLHPVTRWTNLAHRQARSGTRGR